VSQAQIGAAIANGASFATCGARVGRAPSPERVEAEFLRQHRAPLDAGAALSSDRARWYVIAAETNREYRVQELLRRDRFEIWLPECIFVTPATNDRRVTRKPMRRKGPLLPGYVLARFDLNDTTWHRIIATKYVEGLLGAANRPVALRDHDIERVHALIQKYGGIVELRARRSGNALAVLPSRQGGQKSTVPGRQPH
jgi:transcription antitermination factor NusG